MYSRQYSAIIYNKDNKAYLYFRNAKVASNI